MDNLRWWLLLIAAVMFSMSGCASAREWTPGQPSAAVSEDRIAREASVDLSGRWVGTWKGLGLFDSLRQAPAEATFLQHGNLGVAHLQLDSTIAAAVPWIMRVEGGRGVRLVYRVSGPDAVMRHPATPAEMMAAFTLVDDRLIGTLPSAEGPVVITLVRRER
jgi:hypothetical protein